MPSKKIALVIGWGSVKCAAALGLLRVLNREGISLDMVVGSGGGSIFAALIALGYDSAQIVEMNARLWTGEVTSRNRRGAALRLLMPSSFQPGRYFSLKDDRLVNARLRAAFGERRFEDTEIPLFISATDYRTGDQVILSEGSLYAAVRASIALPMIFPPVMHDGRLLVDGFLSEPFPVGVAVQEGADIILAMGFDSTFRSPVRSLSEYLLHISGILSNNLFQSSYAFYSLAHHSEVVPFVPQLAPDIGFFDTSRVPEIIAAGESEGEKQLPFLKKLLEETE